MTLEGLPSMTDIGHPWMAAMTDPAVPVPPQYNYDYDYDYDYSGSIRTSEVTRPPSHRRDLDAGLAESPSQLADCPFSTAMTSVMNLSCTRTIY